MEDFEIDLNRQLMLDGNAAAGILYEIFNLEMTNSLSECATCGNQGEMGSLLVFNQAPGTVMRCPVCENIVMRIVETGESIYLDARGATFLCLKRETR